MIFQPIASLLSFFVEMGDYRVLQGESLEAFNEGIGYILNRWSALRTAVDFMWGGDNSDLKAQQFITDVCSWFAQSRGKNRLITFFLI